MRTPAGFECDYFYADYFRGRNKQECRLVLHSSQPGEKWRPDVCRTCPVPKILWANACPQMVLEGRIVKQWFGLKLQMRVTAFCKRVQQPVKEPPIGCGHCHEQIK